MASTVTPATVSDRRLTLISFVLALGAFVTLLDTTIVNITLDRLQTVFDSSVDQTQWVTAGYLLAFVSVIPLSAWLSERFGARNTWLFAISTFLLGSVLCGVAGSLSTLVVFRVLQGIGGGMVMPITMSMMARAAGPERMGRATAVIGLPALLGPILGSVLGGIIVQSLSWHWVFLVNVPVCLIAIGLGLRLLPADPGKPGHRLDVLGFLLLTPGVVAIAYGVSEVSGADGFGATGAWLPLVAGVLLLGTFARHSLRAGHAALIDVRVFARRSFGAGSLITFMAGFSTYALTLLLPLFYQQVRGETVLHTGLLLIPQGIGVMLFVGVVRPRAARADGRIVVAAGILVTMLGTLPFALANAQGGTALLLAGQLAQGLGFGATTFPILTLALAGLSHDEAPRGSAAFSVVQRVGAPFGVAIVAVILQSMLRNATTTADTLAAFTGTFWWTLAFSAVPLLLVAFLPSTGRDQAGEPAVADH